MNGNDFKECGDQGTYLDDNEASSVGISFGTKVSSAAQDGHCFFIICVEQSITAPGSFGISKRQASIT